MDEMTTDKNHLEEELYPSESDISRIGVMINDSNADVMLHFETMSGEVLDIHLGRKQMRYLMKKFDEIDKPDREAERAERIRQDFERQIAAQPAIVYVPHDKNELKKERLWRR